MLKSSHETFVIEIQYPFARKTSFATREAKEEALSSRNHIWYGRLAGKTILSLYTLKY